MKRFVKALCAVVAALAVPPAFVMGCSLGQGTGSVDSEGLFAQDCWCSQYRLSPDFFAAVPYRDTLQIRVQHGNDLQEVSDGIAVLVDNVTEIRASLLDKKLRVGVPVGVEPPGAGPIFGAASASMSDAGMDSGDDAKSCEPSTTSDDAGTSVDAGYEAGACNLAPLYVDDGTNAEAAPGPATVHLALYLQQSCHNQNAILYAVSGSIMFHALFSGDPNESRATEKLTEAIFDVEVGDIRDIPPGGSATSIPKEKLTNLRGCFRFYFERGQPGQPFP